MAGQIIHQIDWPQYNIRVGEVAPIALQLRDSVENILRVYYAPSNSFTDYSVEVCKTVPHCTVEAGKIPKIARIGFKSVTLEKITEAQQKIKWNRLKIIVVPEPSTNNRWSPEEMNVIH
ncbi:hypothetical protein JW978_02370 [Candidatus Dojkabacteria bacterium]|nr:hypothetical protein [Candidatus Dojkabacteria bacterium]